LIQSPPVELFPEVLVRKLLPYDLQVELEQYQEKHFPGKNYKEILSQAGTPLNFRKAPENL
jgi:hypothetical protein